MDEIYEYYNKHYITVDASSRIIDGWSDGPHPEKDTTDAICINEQGGYQFWLFPGGEENPALFDFEYNIPLYKWDGEVLPRTAEELEADREAERQAAKAAERERIANDPQTILLDMAVDHECRLVMLELGIE